ncbi:MAG: LamG-like jellyroll fold domain-containing protein [Planctomycetota bacterium]|jgi:hypothetical protein
MCRRFFLAVCLALVLGMVGTASGLHLKVDLGLPQCGSTPENVIIVPGTVKEGWWPRVFWGDVDMYMHDFAWEDGSRGADPPNTPGVDGSGVHFALDSGIGDGGYHVHGMCRDNLGGGGCPTGSPVGGPIANGWFHNIDWGGECTGDIHMRITDLPAGRYELISYHNHWEPCSQSTRNCLDCYSNMPPMTGVYAMSLPVAGLPGCAVAWSGTGTGVTPIQDAYNVDVTSVTSDDAVSTSTIQFHTDGSDVLVIYDGGDNTYPDPARPDREGSKGVLNAFEIITVEPPETAWNPFPDDEADEVDLAVDLSWSPGTGAISHDVYFGTDYHAVSDANTSSSEYQGRQNVDVNSYDPCGLLEPGMAYYWRIDEVNGPNTVKGDMWSFVAAEFLKIDDFESYDPIINWIYYAWHDGVDNDTGSVVELGIVPDSPAHGGQQSMEVIYDNGSDWGVGYYSEVEREYSPPEDWTFLGVKALKFFFYGDPGNDANEQMYVVLQDNEANTAVVRYGDNGEDMNDVKEQQWHEWGIGLYLFADGGVSLENIAKIGIGFGEIQGPVPGGSGIVYFDDIRLYVAVCLPELGLVADYTGDCRVDHQELRIMARDWLEEEKMVYPARFDRDGQKGWYWFDETSDVNVSDISGNHYEGYVYQQGGTPAPEWLPSGGKFRGCLRFNGDYGVRLVDAGAPAPHLFSDMDTAVTVAVWLNGESESSGQAVILEALNTADQDPTVVSIYTDPATGSMDFVTGSDSISTDGPDDWVGNWNHFAFVKDANSGLQAIYLNGCLVAKDTDAFCPVAGTTVCSAGVAADRFEEVFVGKMDELRIFNYALPQNQIVGIMRLPELYCPVGSPANIYDAEPVNSKILNAKDFALLAQQWLEERLWPER